MDQYAEPLERLIAQFEKLPGIGHKSATRLAFKVLSGTESDAEEFASAILNAKKAIKTCRICQNLTDREVCPICSDERRDKSVICVVADPKDLMAIENTKEYHGLYHVLHGVISPLNGVSPDDIRITELVSRISEGQVQEVIMATNPDTEGETTALYISRLIRPFGVRITRLAYGVPVGGHLEYSDAVTLSRALEGRREF